jgi:ArsR family transcriptional regulator, arsenate/arsenite/antimonite-responsive transcriptional repressor
VSPTRESALSDGPAGVAPVVPDCAHEATQSPAGSADQQVACLAKALGHPARVAIVRLLLARDACCGEIVEGLPLAQATVSQHLKVLKDAGLVRGEIDGPRICYCIDRERMRELVRLFDELASTPAGALVGAS